MRLAPLQLEQYFIKSLRFDLRAGFDNRETLDDGVTLPEISINNNITQDTEDSRRCRCELTVELMDDPEDKFPYTFAIMLVGIFRVGEKYPDDKVDSLIKVNAPSILYSVAREIALTTTGRGNYPPVLLPSVSFVSPPDESSTAPAKVPKKETIPSASKKSGSKRGKKTDN